MTIEYRKNNQNDAVLMTQILNGAPMSAPISNDLMPFVAMGGAHEVAALREVVARIRMQMSFIVQSCKKWKICHAGMIGEVEVRYSTYEGVLCFQDLRRHWALYRHASRELRFAVAQWEQKNAA